MMVLRRLAAGVLLLAASAAASAACDVTAQGVSFGNYDPMSATALDGVGNVHLSCTLLSTFVTVSIGPGGGTIADRRMIAGATQLHYNLYSDASRLVVWGEGSESVGATVLLSSDLPVYGRIPALQNVTAGMYLDSVTVTITY